MSVPVNWFKENLREQGYLLVVEFDDRKLEVHPGMKLRDAYPTLIAELRLRCPGFSDREYSDAIANGLEAHR